MFKQQFPPHTVHPYQTNTVTYNNIPTSTATNHRIKFPWSEDSNQLYQTNGTESSTSDGAYHIPQYFEREYGPSSPVYQTPYEMGTWRSSNKFNTNCKKTEPCPFPQCSSAFSLQVCNEVPSRSCSPVPPGSSVSPDVAVIGACGGNCPRFEYVCYYILQVIFVVGILTGISLSIAGIVLRRTNRNGDLGVLVYIGCLSSCVCAVLLGVQCCVRREIRERKIRANMHIALQPMPELPVTSCPLLSSTLSRSQIYRPTAICPEEEISREPWWRRNERD